MKKQAIEIICMILVGLLFTGCKGCPERKVLIDTQTLYVTAEGHKAEVHDLVDNRTYTFTAKRVRRSEGIPEPMTAVSTNSLTVETLGNSMRITDKAGTVYRIRFGRGVYHHGEKDF